MIKNIYIYFVISILLLGISSCRSSFEKRVNKDIVGINEQLYDLEKEQIKSAQQIQEIKQDADRLKKEKENQVKKTQDDPDKIYKEGYKNYLEQKYSKAIELLSQMTGKLRDNSLTDNALYWQAESYFKLDKIDDALSYYQLVYRYYPFSNKADYSLYKIGMIYYNRRDYTRALWAFNRLTGEYPGSDLHKAATIKTNQIKRDNKRRKK